MNADRWDQAQTLFKEIIELDRDSRATRLQEIRDTDAGLYAEIESLLAADEDPTSILDGFAIDSIDIAGLLSMDGSRIGPFEIDSLIGSGGMGSVYRARRVHGGFEQQVALKLIKVGMDSEQILRRFQSERSILARLEHPNIARLVDGGLTEDGRPWFAMEYVQGEPIDRYRNRLNLSIERRLELFMKVASAVQYAHRNLLVHRDLKPDNIMVSDADESAQIKLLDFGIARLLDDDTNDTLFSTQGVRPMTRAYASPEQLRGEPVTIASDIYSLGIIFYELLTGRRPFEKRDLSTTEFEDLICTSNPVEPSKIVQADFAKAGNNRRAKKLQKKLEGDLDVICLKALRREPERRYETVGQFAEDIRRHFEGLPVIARSESQAYRIQKFVSRHKTGVTAAGLILLLLIIGVAAFAWQYRVAAAERDRAQTEARRATRIASVLGSSLRSIDPVQNRGEELSARMMLDQSTSLINNQLGDDPQTRSELLIMMADIYSNLIAYEQADSISLAAQKLMRTAQDTVSYAYINVLARRSVILDKAGKFEQASELINEAVSLANEHLAPSSLSFAGIHLDYVYHLDVEGRYEKADSVLAMLDPIYRQNRKAAEEEYADFIFYQGMINRRLGNYRKAEKYLFESLALSRERYPDVHEQIASTLNHISSLYQNMDEHEQAIPYAIESHEMRVKIFGSGHLNALASHANIARAYFGADKLKQATNTYRRVIVIFREEYGNENFYIAGLLQSLGGVYVRMEQYKRAEEVIRESLQRSERLLPERHLRMAYPLYGLANALKKQGRYKEALPYAERAYAIRNNQLPEDNPVLLSTRYMLGYCLWQLNRKEEAKPHLNSALAFYNTHPDRFEQQLEEIKELGF